MNIMDEIYAATWVLVFDALAVLYFAFGLYGGMRLEKFAYIILPSVNTAVLVIRLILGFILRMFEK